MSCCSRRPGTASATSTSTIPTSSASPTTPWVAYGRAKTANVLCAVGLDQRLRDQGVRAFAVHPGGIPTELGRHLTDETLGQMVERSQGRQRALEDGPAGRRHHRVRRHRPRARRRRRRRTSRTATSPSSPTIPRSPAASAPTPSTPPAPTPSGSSASASFPNVCVR